MQIDIHIDAGKTLGPLRQIWRFFGYDEPNYTYMRHGRKLVQQIGEMNGPHVPGIYFRCHNLLTTGDGEPALKWGSTNAYTEDDSGKPVYDWTIVDQIFDTYIDNGCKPYVQVGFMPQALSTVKEPYRHYWKPGVDYWDIVTGWAHPPEDYEKWWQLVHAWVMHCVDKYGRDEVASWYWQTWNEANIPYWKGTPEEFHKLHDYTIDAIRAVMPEARVGGPDSAGGGTWLRRFLWHCAEGTNHKTGKKGTPTDFVSFHAKGDPKFVEKADGEGHVRMGIANQLRVIDENFSIIASIPAMKDKPIVIGESDPEGCAACQGPNLAYRNGTMYSSYTAASFARKQDLADRYGVNFAGALTWAFEFEDQPYFAGFRALATNGIAKPVLNTFRMMSKMSGDRLEVQSSGAVSLDDMMHHGVRDEADVHALSSYDPQTKKLCVLTWHYHDDDVPGDVAEVRLKLANLPGERWTMNHYLIDEDHSNAYTAWQRMGEPQSPSDAQYAELDAASELQTAADERTVSTPGGSGELSVSLTRQAVALLVLTLA